MSHHFEARGRETAQTAASASNLHSLFVGQWPQVWTTAALHGPHTESTLRRACQTAAEHSVDCKNQRATSGCYRPCIPTLLQRLRLRKRTFLWSSWLSISDPDNVHHITYLASKQCCFNDSYTTKYFNELVYQHSKTKHFRDSAVFSFKRLVKRVVFTFNFFLMYLW